MYQQDFKNEQNVPTAPSSYSESVSTQHLSHNPQQNNPQHDNPKQAYPDHSQYAPQVPAQVIVQAPTLPPLGSEPTKITCPKCKAIVLTRVNKGGSNMAYLFCSMMSIFFNGCVYFACLPFCMDKFKNYEHTCPRCNTFIGKFRPS